MRIVPWIPPIFRDREAAGRVLGEAVGELGRAVAPVDNHQSWARGHHGGQPVEDLVPSVHDLILRLRGFLRQR